MTEMTATPRTPTPLEAARRRWPALAAVAFAALMAADLAQGVDIAPVLAALGVVYLGTAALRRPGAAWPLFFATIAVALVAGLLVEDIDTTWVLLGLGALLALYGLAFRGAAHPAHGLPLQGLALLVLGAIATVAPSLPLDIGAYLVAAGLLAHTVWDLHHFRTRRVVARSLAEFCMVLDTLLAVAIIAVTVTS